MKDRKLAGLWIDNSKAVVAKNHDDQNAFKFFLCSPIKHEAQHGNSNENTAHNSAQTTKAKFFKEIEHMITNSTELFLTGPGTIQEELKRHLNDTAQYKNLKISLDSSQQMSDEQVLNTVKAHFGE